LAVSNSAMLLAPVWPWDFSRGDAQGRRMAEDETGEVPKLPPDARLESLDERLDRLQQAEAKRTEVQRINPGTRIAQQAFGHLIGAPVGGAVIGWGIDSLAAMAGHKTFPLFLLLMLFFGFGVGLRNVIRITNTRSSPGN
jgi:ATP synthase protein I